MAWHGHLLPRGAPLSTLAIKGGQRRKVWHDIICKRKCAQVESKADEKLLLIKRESCINTFCPKY